MDTSILASRIKLVTLTTGAFRPVKLNKQETKEENDRHGLKDEAKVSVRITSHPALVGVRDSTGALVKQGLFSLHAEAYTKHKSITLPSVQDGIRQIPMGKELDHAQIMLAYYGKHLCLVEEFMADYPAERLSAPSRLNGLYDAKAWPSEERVKEQFQFATRYLPCPTDGAWADWLAESAQAGQAELRERLVSAARHLADVCKGDGKLYQSALDNLRDICDLAGQGFNLLDDPIIAKAALELRPVAVQSAEVLRESKSSRRQTSERASEILSTLKLA